MKKYHIHERATFDCEVVTTRFHSWQDNPIAKLALKVNIAILAILLTACLGNVYIPQGMLVAMAAIAVLGTLTAFALALRGKGKTIIGTHSSNDFLVSEKQVVWFAGTQEGVIVDIPLFRGGYQIEKNGRGYVISGRPSKFFVQCINGTAGAGREHLWTMPKISLYIRPENQEPASGMILEAFLAGKDAARTI